MTSRSNHFEQLNRDFKSLLTVFSIQEITGKARWKPYVKDRERIALSLRAMGYSATDIGHVMNRDHTSIIYIYRKNGVNPKNKTIQKRELQKVGSFITMRRKRREWLKSVRTRKKAGNGNKVMRQADNSPSLFNSQRTA